MRQRDPVGWCGQIIALSRGFEAQRLVRSSVVVVLQKGLQGFIEQGYFARQGAVEVKELPPQQAIERFHVAVKFRRARRQYVQRDVALAET